jgi:hypothetical protein
MPENALAYFCGLFCESIINPIMLPDTFDIDEKQKNTSIKKITSN